MARNQVRLDIEHREPFAGGGSFGNTGSYERLYGKAHFAIDPDEKGLPSIVDLDLVPRKAQVLVEFAATLDIIKPVEPGRRNRRILYKFSNRGLMGFNYGRGADMSKPEYAGDGFLMRQGYTLMRCLMDYDVIQVKPLGHLHLAVWFRDGLSGEVEFRESHLYGVFEALKDPEFFQQVHCKQGFVEWPGELDLAPDAMHEAIKKHGRWILE